MWRESADVVFESAVHVLYMKIQRFVSTTSSVWIASVILFQVMCLLFNKCNVYVAQ